MTGRYTSVPQEKVKTRERSIAERKGRKRYQQQHIRARSKERSWIGREKKESSVPEYSGRITYRMCLAESFIVSLLGMMLQR